MVITPKTIQLMPESIPQLAQADQDAWARFHKAYGEAMAAWSAIEHAILTLFAKSTKMDEITAQAVFFSAKSFNSRIDMFTAALKVDNRPKDILELLIEIRGRAAGYSGTRNQLAHHYPVLWHPEIMSAEVSLIPNKVLSKEGRENPRNDPSILTVDDIEQTAENFNKLAEIATRADHRKAREKGPLRDTLLKQVLELPCPPYSTDRHKTTSMPSRRHKPSRASRSKDRP